MKLLSNSDQVNSKNSREGQTSHNFLKVWKNPPQGIK